MAQQSIEKKGGPYTAQQRVKRRNQVARLHIENGYSASKIAEVLKVNRNTINSDIDNLYSVFLQEIKQIDFNAVMMKQIHRLNTQRTRLVEQLDNDTLSFHERISIEKFIFEIDSKFTTYVSKMIDKADKAGPNDIHIINKFLETRNKVQRIISSDEFLLVSEEALPKIKEILEKDRKKHLLTIGDRIL